MTDTPAGDLEARTLLRLRDRYEASEVVAQPRFEGATVYPDFAVYADTEHSSPHFLVECSSLRSPHRIQKDLEEISEAVDRTDATYGALIGPDLEFVFSGTGPAYQTHGQLPPIDSRPTDRRPIQSQTELQFLAKQTLDAHRVPGRAGGEPTDATTAFFDALHLLLEARRENIDLSQTNSNTVTQLRDGLANRFDSYQRPDDADLEMLQAVVALFDGFDLVATADDTLEALFEITGDKRAGEYSTPVEIARQMVRLSEPVSGDVVLDPAAGQGTVLTVATTGERRGVGVELNSSILNLALFFTDLFGRDIELIREDFLSSSVAESLPDDIDHVIVDPPFNADTDGSDVPFAPDRLVDSQDAFLSKALDVVNTGGSVTAAVPYKSLFEQRSGWIREVLLDRFQIDAIVQVVDGPVFRHTSIDTAFLSLTKTEPSADHEIRHVTLDSPDDAHSAFSDAISAVTEGTADTIAQSALSDSLDIHAIAERERTADAVRDEFGRVAPLETIATVEKGTRRPKDEHPPDGDDGLPYLSPKDVRDGSATTSTRMVGRNQARTVADDSSVLIGETGSPIYLPNSPVVPSNNWHVIQFDSPAAATVYEVFLSSDLGQAQLETSKQGSVISRIPTDALRELTVPVFDDATIREKAREISEHDRRLAEIERRQADLADERDSLLTEGDDGE